MISPPPSPAREATVQDLAFFDLHVTVQTRGTEVAQLFEKDRTLPGVLVLDEEKVLGVIARNQFFQRLSRLYGIEVYLGRPISVYLETLRTPALILPQDTSIQAAVVACLARPLENVYDPFVVSLREGRPRLIDFFTLILRQTDLLHAAQAEAEHQKAQAIAANEAKSNFLAHMSHELRTPLTAIIGYGEILQEDLAEYPQKSVLPRLQNIITAGNHLLNMINGILDLAKIESGHMDLSLEAFSLTHFLEDITTTVQILLVKNRNRFHFLPPPDLGLIYSDPLKLKQCLLNLLGNAAKFTQDGKITLQVEATEDCITFRIQDTGIGMTEEQQQRLFEPFYQADTSISRRYGGTGLGLSLTKRNVELLGGSLHVASASRHGTTFTLRVPRKAAP